MESGSVKRHVITAVILLGRHERRPSRLPRGEAHRTARTLPGVHARARTGLCTSPQAKSDVTVALGHRKAAASGLRARARALRWPALSKASCPARGRATERGRDMRPTAHPLPPHTGGLPWSHGACSFAGDLESGAPARAVPTTLTHGSREVSENRVAAQADRCSSNLLHSKR